MGAKKGGKLTTNRLAQASGKGKKGLCRTVFLQLKGGKGDLAERLMDIWRRQRIPLYDSNGDCVAEVRFYRDDSELKNEKDRASRGISRAFVSMVES